jgi:transposase
VLYPQNTGHHLCIDEVALTEGELYTVATNANARCQKGSLVAMVKGCKSENVIKILQQIPLDSRLKVKEVSCDMANSMEKIARDCFGNAKIVTDRFHVAQLVSEAVQEIRVKLRWKAIDDENEQIQQARREGKIYVPFTLENGDTPKQILARSRYLLFKPEHKRTDKQEDRSKLLFSHFPELEQAYNLSMMFRNIYETALTKGQADKKIKQWCKKVNEKNLSCFNTVVQTINNHKETILNYFENRTTNALAESFNSKLKAFRSVFRGVRDVPFFIYRVSLIFA